MNPADPFGTPKPADPWDWLAAMSRRMQQQELIEADRRKNATAALLRSGNADSFFRINDGGKR